MTAYMLTKNKRAIRIGESQNLGLLLGWLHHVYSQHLGRIWIEA